MPDEEFYVDHGKKVDKDGKLILEVDDKPWLLNAIFDFKTYAVFFLWSLLFENLLRVYARISFYTIACGIAGLYVGFKVWKSEIHKRRDIILAIGYAYCLLLSSTGLRRAVFAYVYSTPTHCNPRFSLTLALFLDISFIWVVVASMALMTFTGIEKIFCRGDKKWKSFPLFFLLLAFSLIWLPFPPQGFNFVRKVLRNGAGLIYRNEGRAQWIVEFWSHPENKV